jgi:hypothetical protein
MGAREIDPKEIGVMQTHKNQRMVLSPAVPGVYPLEKPVELGLSVFIDS